jgi:hypothetical protein
MSNRTASGRTPKVWVLWDWDDKNDRPRGKTHALDCHMIDTFHWAKGDYRKVDVTDIPDYVGRCGFCGGGRPPSKGRDARPTLEVVEVLGRSMLSDSGAVFEYVTNSPASCVRGQS